ncbi:hypothetical protein [Aliivibrio fischeri]|uniref:hypothetical protein n=1 Tax=Aliivibrio fischeri TaxID=668 RepID=UPI0007C5956A|nr:hypothetical protein [Aliivibrio fischeri]
MKELLIIVVGYKESGDICHLRSLPIYQDEIDSLVRTVEGIFKRQEMVKTIEVKLDISTQITASSVEGLSQLKQQLKAKFERLEL